MTGVGAAADASRARPPSSSPRMTPRFGNPAISCQPPRSFCASSGGLPTLEEMSSSSATAVRASVRPEIQALRAVAIGCVVLYHFWPAVLPAGFVGVDVFFVVSGFLITGLLLRDAERHGRVRLQGVLRAPGPAHPAGRARGAERLRGRDAPVRAAGGVAAVPAADPLELALRAELAPRARLADPEPRRPRVDAGPALLVAVGRGAVLPRVAAAHHPRALAGDAPRASPPGAHRGRARGRDRRLVRARRDPDRAGPQPRVLLDALAGLGVRRGRPARHRARRRGGAAAAHARPRRVDRPRRDRGRGAHVHRPPSCSPARSPWCRCSAPRP